MPSSHTLILKQRICLLVVYTDCNFFFKCPMRIAPGTGIIQIVLRQTRDRQVASSIPGRGGREKKIFRDNFLC